MACSLRAAISSPSLMLSSSVPPQNSSRKSAKPCCEVVSSAMPSRYLRLPLVSLSTRVLRLSASSSSPASCSDRPGRGSSGRSLHWLRDQAADEGLWAVHGAVCQRAVLTADGIGERQPASLEGTWRQAACLFNIAGLSTADWHAYSSHATGVWSWGVHAPCS